MTKSIVLLSGPVGAGKTTVARELVPLLQAPVAYIEGDVFWTFMPKSQNSSPMPESFRTVMSSMMAAAVPIAASGSTVVVDFSIPPWYLKTARTIASVRQLPIHYAVLRPSELVCAERAAARAEGRISDYARFRELYQSFDEAPDHIVANDSAAPKEAAKLIAEGLSAGRFEVA